MKFKDEIENLIQKRQKWIDSSKENNFDYGIFKLLTELYPDEAHFIYEMLQNAEDAGNRAGIKSNTVTFDLKQNELIFSHQGEPFSYADIDSITGISNSTKKDDTVSIGKFGIGFKSVFAYTDTPIIKDRNVIFKIKDLVLPEMLENEYDQNTQGVYFEIPFNHRKNSINPTKKSPKKCYEEIAKLLKEFTGIELLFLRNITCMIIKYGECEVKFTKTYDKKTHIAEIHKKDVKTSKIEQQKWVAFYQDIPEHKNLYTSFAFALEDKKIQPIKGKLFVYFPADKETTNLKFHIHAPFASTVARDSIPYTNEENIKIRDALAEHFRSVILELSQLGYLDKISAFSIFPNKKSSLSPFYEPLHNTMIKTMETDLILPTETGNKASAQDVVRIQDRKFKELFASPESREFLFDGKEYCQEPQSGSEAYTLLAEVTSLKNDSEIKQLINEKFDEKAEYIKEQPTKWIVDLYTYLVEKSFTCVGHILRDKKGKFYEQISTDKEALFDTDFCPDLLKACKEKMGNDAILNLRKLGIWELDEEGKLEILKRKHSKLSGKKLLDVYPADNEQESLKLYKKEFDKLYGNDKLCGICLLSKDNMFYETSKLYSDSLDKLIIQGDSYVLNSMYKNEYKKLSISKSIIPTQYDEPCHLRNPAYHADGNRTHKYISKDYKFKIDIKHIFDEIENNSSEQGLELSVLLWRRLDKHEKWQNASKAKFRPNASYSINEADSTVKNQLNKAWLFDTNMNLVSPEDIYFENLHPKYKFYKLVGDLCDILEFQVKSEELKIKFGKLSPEQQQKALDLLEEEENKQSQDNTLSPHNNGNSTGTKLGTQPFLRNTRALAPRTSGSSGTIKDPIQNQQAKQEMPNLPDEENTKPVPPYSPQPQSESKGSGSTSDSADRKHIEKKAVKNITDYYEKQGYKVTSVEQDNKGWDLEATKNEETLYLEVKGRGNSQYIAQLSPNEYAQMQANKTSYRVCISNTSGIKIFHYDNKTEDWIDNSKTTILYIETKGLISATVTAQPI